MVIDNHYDGQYIPLVSQECLLTMGDSRKALLTHRDEPNLFPPTVISYRGEADPIFLFQLGGGVSPLYGLRYALEPTSAGCCIEQFVWL